MRRFTAAALAILGVGLPPQMVARSIAATPTATVEDVTLGLWLLKAALLLLAGVLLFAGRVKVPGEQGEALVPAGDDEPILPRAGWMLAGLLAAGAVVRLIGLGEGLWFDEIRALVNYGRMPLAGIVTTFDSQNQHLLYSLTARLSLLAFGESAFALRLPAALFGVGSLWAAYLFARRVAGTRVALLTAALLTFSYHHVWFSQNARGYSALLFFTLLGSERLLRLLSLREGKRWGVAAGYAACMTLALYTNVTGVLVLAAHGLVWLGLVMRRRAPLAWPAVWAPAAGFVMVALLTTVLYAPVLPQFFGTIAAPTMPGAETAWKNPAWFFAELVRGLARGLPGGWVTAVAAGLIGVAGLVDLARRRPAALAVMVLPGALMVLLLMVMEHNLWPRLFFFCAGFAVLIGVQGVFAVSSLLARGRAPTFATAALVLATAASATTVPTAWLPKQDFDGARSFIQESRGPGDAVVLVDMTRVPYREYMALDWRNVESAAELEAIEESHRKTWVVYVFPTRLEAVQPEIMRRLEHQYATAAEFPGTVGGGAVIVKVRG